MNHPFFYLSIAALAPFYCILFLSLIRDVIRSHSASASDKAPNKPDRSTKKNNLTFKTLFQAHWIDSESVPAIPLTLFERPLTGQLSVN